MTVVKGQTGTVEVTDHVSPDTTTNVIDALNVTKWTLHSIRKMNKLTPKAESGVQYVPGAIRWWVVIEGLADTTKTVEWYNRKLVTVKLLHLTGLAEEIKAVGYFTELDTSVDLNDAVRWRGRFESTQLFDTVAV